MKTKDNVVSVSSDLHMWLAGELSILAHLRYPEPVVG